MKHSYLDSFLPADPLYRKLIIQYGAKFGITFILILYFIYLLNLIRNDKSSLSNKNMALYLIGVIVPLVIFCYFILSSIEDKKNLAIVFVMIIIVTFMLLRSISKTFNQTVFNIINYLTEITPLPPLSDTTSFIITLTSKILFFCIIIIALSIIYNVFLNESYRQKGLMGFIIYLIFLIPCLVSDFIRNIFQFITNSHITVTSQDVKNKEGITTQGIKNKEGITTQLIVSTPQIVYILLLIEIILILLYFYLPKLLSKIYRPRSDKILLNPTYFNYETVVSDIKPFVSKEKYVNGFELNKFDEKGILIDNNNIMKQYCISMWMITNHPNIGEDQECMMFRYGNIIKEKLGCPYISCKNNGKWKFVLSNTTDTTGNILETELIVPMQRWNYVVFNYHDLEVDIFINGILRETLSLGKNIPSYTSDMNITIGSDDNILHGAICNLTVSLSNMNLTQIVQSYNLLKLKNPPVNNLI